MYCTWRHCPFSGSRIRQGMYSSYLTDFMNTYLGYVELKSFFHSMSFICDSSWNLSFNHWTLSGKVVGEAMHNLRLLSAQRLVFMFPDLTDRGSVFAQWWQIYTQLTQIWFHLLHVCTLVMFRMVGIIAPLFPLFVWMCLTLGWSKLKLQFFSTCKILQYVAAVLCALGL